MEAKDIDGMMHGGFWKDILYDIVKSMNPWDIEIAQLASGYAKRVEEMEEMDFKVPANVIIVSSVLLRMKADMIASINFNPEDYRDPAIDEDMDFISPDFDPILFGESSPEMMDELMDWSNVAIAIKPRRVPKRKVSVFELVSAIHEVLEDKKVKSFQQKIKKDERVMEINIERSIEKIIEETYIKVMEILANRNMVPFSELAGSRDEIVSTLISLLHLSNKQRLKLRQDKLFDEIFIKAA